jgi:hypothetical protein
LFFDLHDFEFGLDEKHQQNLSLIHANAAPEKLG